MKIRIQINRLIFPMVFLLSIFLHTEFASISIFISIKHLFILGSIGWYFFNMYRVDKLLNAIILLVILEIICSFLINNVSFINIDMLYGYMLYALPFLFDHGLFTTCIEQGAKLTFIIAFILLVFWRYLGLFEFWNDNIIAYLYFGGINSFLFISSLEGGIKKIKHFDVSTIILFLMYVMAIFTLMHTNSRNVFIAQTLVLLFYYLKKIFINKYVYIFIAVFVVIYAAFMIVINEYVQTNREMMNFISTLSSTYFQKNTVFDGRLLIQREVLQLIHQNIFTKLLGYCSYPNALGIATHNNFLTITYEFGFIGYILFVCFIARILFIGYKNIKNGDNISFISILIIMGYLIQLSAESFLIGNDIIVLLPYFYMGIILTRRRKYVKKKIYNLD